MTIRTGGIITLLALAGCGGTVSTGEGPCPGGEAAWFDDADGDGYGSDESWTCEPRPDDVRQGGDCDDEDADQHPGGRELCNGEDDDCDGALHPEERDEDGDGFAFCRECDDGNGEVYPGARERCNGIDDDCDEEIDEIESTSPPWYRDADGDGFGDAEVVERACEPPTGFVADDTDCDDADASIWPGAWEQCDELDHDCDGSPEAAWSVASNRELERAVDEAEDGQTICIAPGTYDVSLEVKHEVRIEGTGAAGEVVITPTEAVVPAIGLNRRAPGLHLHRLTLKALVGASDVLMATAGEIHLADVRLIGEGTSCIDVRTGRGTWQRVEIAGFDCRTSSSGISTEADVTDLHLHDVTFARPHDHGGGRYGIVVGSLVGGLVERVRVESFGPGDKLQLGPFLYAQRMEDVDIRDTTLAVVPEQEILVGTGGPSGAMLRATTAKDLRIIGVEGVVHDSLGTLLMADRIEGLEIAEVDLDARVSRGLVAPVPSTTEDVLWQDLTVDGVRIRATGGIYGGLLSARSREPRAALAVERVRATSVSLDAPVVRGGLIDLWSSAYDLDLSGIDLRGWRLEADAVSGVLVSHDATGVRLDQSVLADITAVGAPVRLTDGSGAVEISFATWRGLSLAGEEDRHLLGNTCAIDHLDLSASTLTGRLDACDVTWSNRWDVEGAPFAATDEEPAYVDVSGDAATWDLHPDTSSPLVDAGDPTVKDADGSRADISAYGGE